MNRIRNCLIVVAGLAAGAAAPSRAQSPLLDPGAGSAVWLQLQRPSLEADATTYLLDAGARLRLGARSQLVVQVPFVYVAEDLPSPASRSLLGNPYIGLRQSAGNTAFELGGRVPVVSSSGNSEVPMVIGVLADFDQLEAYLPEVVTLYGRISGEMAPAAAQGVFARFRAGPTVFIPTGEGGDNVEVWADYHAVVGFRAPMVELAAGLTGRAVLTNAEGASIGERTVHQLTIGGTLRAARIRPTLFLRVPLDETLEDLKSVIGVGVVIALR